MTATFDRGTDEHQYLLRRQNRGDSLINRLGDLVAKKNRIGTKGVTKTDIPDFEGALAEVENVVRRLEGGELGLTEALAEYERGIAKIKICHDSLQQAELKIQLLTQVDEDGTPRVESVDRTPPIENGEESSSDVDDGRGLF